MTISPLGRVLERAVQARHVHQLLVRNAPATELAAGLHALLQHETHALAVALLDAYAEGMRK